MDPHFSLFQECIVDIDITFDVEELLLMDFWWILEDVYQTCSSLKFTASTTLFGLV